MSNKKELSKEEIEEIEQLADFFSNAYPTIFSPSYKEKLLKALHQGIRKNAPIAQQDRACDYES